jgi:hypothetical protein
MKKIYSLIALLLISGVVFGQAQKVNGKLTAVKVIKHINALPSSHAKAVTDSLHYDGDNSDGIGTGGATSFGVYSFFGQDSLAQFSGKYILSEKLFIVGATNVTSAELRFYTDTLASAMVFSQPFIPIEGWNNVPVYTPFAVPTTGNLYVGYYITATGGYPAGCDAGPIAASGNGNWINMGAWAHLNDLNSTLTFNWNIRVMIGDLPTTPVAYCSPLSWNAGNVNVSSSATSGTFTLTNGGVGTLTCSGITGLSAPMTCTLVPANVNLAGGANTTFTFSYNPTVTGPCNETVVIATNGGNITISLNGNGTSCNNAITSYPWTESFEDASFPPACWTKANPDGGTGWDMITSGTTPIPGFNGGTMSTPTGGGNQAAYVEYETGGASSNDQWLITPKFTMAANKDLSFWVYWFGTYQDHLDVKVSTTDNATASFTSTILTLDSNSLDQNAWKQVSASLASYSTQNIYLAFNEHVADNYTDGAFLAIDLVKVDVASGISDNKTDSPVSIFPNPAKDILHIAANNIKSVVIYNIMGAQVAAYGNVHTINVSDLSVGSYIVKVITDSKAVTQKIDITR